jgi:hypothetical protein
LYDLTVTYEGHNEVVPCRPPDVSTRGMFINTNSSFPDGAVLHVRFRLARTGEEIQTRAEVRYCLPGAGVGVEFIEISPASLRAIRAEIALWGEPATAKKIPQSE